MTTRLLVLRLSALGDVVHTIPAVIALREALPAARISWVVEAPYRELVELVAGVETIPVRLKHWSRHLRASRRDIHGAMRAMREASVAVDFQGLVKSAVLGAMSGAKTRYGFDAEAIREKAALMFINEPVRVDPSLHVIEQNLQLAHAVRAAGGRPIPPDLRDAGVGPRVPAPARYAFDRFPADPDGKLRDFADAVVLLPGAGKANKLWPAERFAALARQLRDGVVAAWGPGEQHLAEAIGCRVAPPTNLRELAWLLRHARVVVGADTGPLHLAAALGTPVVALFGPTNPRRNGPYGQADRVVEAKGPTKLMDAITVEDVMTTLRKVVAG